MSGSDFRFIYWDDVPVSKENKDVSHEGFPSPCSNHAAQQQEEEDKLAEQRMLIILRNGNSGEHYEIYDDEDIDPEN